MGALVLALAVAAVVHPGKTPDYLGSISPKESGWGWAIYESSDKSGALEKGLEADWSQKDQWTEGGNITYSDVCNNYMANRFLYVEWGWPKDDLLRIEVRRKSVLEAIFNRD